MASSAIAPHSYEKVLVDVGFITAAEMRYHFFVTAHLGNVRVVVNDAGLVEQVNQFYPYGEATDMGQALPASVDNPYKWGGKEWDEDQGAYDFGARMYSAADARWTTMDPMSEKYYHISPYAYCAGDPVNLVDPDGRDWYSYIDENGTEQWQWIFGNTDPTYEDNNGIVWTRSSSNSVRLSVGGQDITLSQKDDGTLDMSMLEGIMTAGAFTAGEIGNVAEASNATFRMTNSKGNLDSHYYKSGWAKRNQYIKPSQISKVSTVGKGLSMAGRAVGVLNVGLSANNFFQSTTDEERIEHGLDITMGLVGFIPGVGTGLSLYWTVLGKKVYYEYTLPNIINGQPIKLPEPY